MRAVTDIYQDYLRDVAWPTTLTHKELATMGLGMSGEVGEAQEHYKKVIRNYDWKFEDYPPDQTQAALLEFGDALHYLLKCAQQFGFSLELLMMTNMDKLDKRKGRIGWRDRPEFR